MLTDKVKRGNLVIMGLAVGVMPTNCYLVWDNISKEAVVIDPADEVERIVSWIEKEDLELKAILLTHGHFDHVFAVDELREKYGVKAYIHELEQEVLADTTKNCAYMIDETLSMKADVLVKDNEELEFGSLKLKVIHTPGHTHGGVCYYFEDADTLFSGDTLFCRTVGRDDLPTGSREALYRSIKERLLVLPEQVIVFPGHRGPTTIGAEKKGSSW